MRPTFANVAAGLALFISLGGTSYAVSKLPKNSVGTEQVRDGSLRPADLAAGTLLSGPRGPRGAEGPAGPQGPAGATGPAAIDTVNPAAFRVHNVAAQDTLAATQLKVLFGAEDFDPGNVFNPETSTFTAPVDGYYQLEASVEMVGSGDVQRRVLMQIKVAPEGMTIRGSDATTTSFFQANAAGIVKLRRGDTASVSIFTDIASRLNGPSANTWFGGYLISRS